jgi:hypothetical protein
MEQMKISEDMKVPLNYDAKDLSREIKELQPVVFKEGDAYCCLLGPDPQAGIFGFGPTPKKAMTDWEQNLEKRMEKPIGDDDVAQYVHDVLTASTKKVW